MRSRFECPNVLSLLCTVAMLPSILMFSSHIQVLVNHKAAALETIPRKESVLERNSLWNLCYKDIPNESVLGKIPNGICARKELNQSKC